MKMIVLNGSPKGNLSVTLQHVHYIQKKFPQHQLETYHIAERIKTIEKKEVNYPAAELRGIKIQNLFPCCHSCPVSSTG